MKEGDNERQLMTFTESSKVKGRATRPSVIGCFSGCPKSLGPLGTDKWTPCLSCFVSVMQITCYTLYFNVYKGKDE